MNKLGRIWYIMTFVSGQAMQSLGASFDFRTVQGGSVAYRFSHSRAD